MPISTFFKIFLILLLRSHPIHANFARKNPITADTKHRLIQISILGGRVLIKPIIRFLVLILIRIPTLRAETGPFLFGGHFRDMNALREACVQEEGFSEWIGVVTVFVEVSGRTEEGRVALTVLVIGG